MQKMQFYNNNNYNNVSVVSILILLNVVVYCLFQANIFNFIGDSHYYIKELFCMNSDALVKSQIWRFITYMFLHENIKHLIINIILIYCFGSIIEKIFGGIYFLIIYIFIGLFASILYIISMKLLDINIYYINIIGSGPLIYGMISVSGLLFPNKQVFIFFKIIVIVIVLISIKFLDLIFSAYYHHPVHLSTNIIQIGGVIGGIFTVYAIKYLLEIKNFLRKFFIKSKLTTDSNNFDATSEDINRILNKISKNGSINCLSEEEIKILQDFRNKMQNEED